MELDDIKDTWNEMDNFVNRQIDLKPNKFDHMNRLKYRLSLKKIIIPELAGDIVCLITAGFIGFRFYTLDNLAYQIVGIGSILLLLFLPVLSIMSILPLYKAIDYNSSFAGALKDFETEKIRFCRLQKLNLLLSHLLLVMMLLLLTKLFGKHEVTQSPYYFIFSFGIGYIFLSFVSRRIYRSYSKTIRNAQDSLKDLEV